MSCGILLLLPQGMSETHLVLSLTSILVCVLKTTRTQIQVEGASAWKCLPEAKVLGKAVVVDRKASCRDVIFPGKAQTVGNGKKGSVSKRKRENCGLRSS